MGRTVIPARCESKARLDELRRFLHCLRAEERVAFDRLYTDARKHLSAVTYANPLDPNDLLQWSAILELEMKVEALKQAVEELKDSLRRLGP